MNKNEVLKMLSILQVSYPNFYKGMQKKELQEVVDFYEEMFCDDDSRLVLLALKEVINTSEYPPTIATIKNKMFDLTHKEQYSNDELWDALVKAIGRSGYYAEEEFEKLPDLVKRYVRSPRQLQELARIDSDIIHSVEKGQFMKQIEKIKQEYKNDTITKRNDRLLQEKEVFMLEDVE